MHTHILTTSLFIVLFLTLHATVAVAGLDFAAPRAFSASYLSAAGKFDADNYLDVVSAMGGRLVISRANGDGTFAEPTTILNCSSFSNSGFSSPVVGDYNGDGKMDIASVED